MLHNKQYTLQLNREDDATFANFLAGPNKLAVQTLPKLNATSHGQFVYLYGESGLGCSHLAMATCHNLGNLGLPIAYLPLKECIKFTPALFDNLENMFFVCLDDLDCIIGQKTWEEALFHCFNKLQDNGKNLLVTATKPPKMLNFILPDLQSRFNNTIILNLQNLDDAEKLAALSLRASNRGLDLPTTTAKYLLQHYERDFKTLFLILDQLAQEALRTKRQLTIPFVKAALHVTLEYT